MVPQVSLITVCFNDLSGLELTLEAVSACDFENLEHIVVDGGSSDGTPEYLDTYDRHRITWLSERDNGIYDAMNKGAQLAKGNYLIFLNAGDKIFPEALKELVELDCTLIDCMVCSLTIVRGDGLSYLFEPKMPQVNELPVWGMPFGHMGMVISRELFLTIGGYSTKFRVSADYEFVLRMTKEKINFKKTEITLGIFFVGGVSGGLRTVKENFTILRAYNVPIITALMSCARVIIFRSLGQFLPIQWVRWLQKIRSILKNL